MGATHAKNICWIWPHCVAHSWSWKSRAFNQILLSFSVDGVCSFYNNKCDKFSLEVRLMEGFPTGDWSLCPVWNNCVLLLLCRLPQFNFYCIQSTCTRAHICSTHSATVTVPFCLTQGKIFSTYGVNVRFTSAYVNTHLNVNFHTVTSRPGLEHKQQATETGFVYIYTSYSKILILPVTNTMTKESSVFLHSSKESTTKCNKLIIGNRCKKMYSPLDILITEQCIYCCG